MALKDRNALYFQAFLSFSTPSESAMILGCENHDACRMLTKAALTFFVRAAPTEDGLNRQEWKKVEKGAFALGHDDRHLQYRAVFHSDNGDRYPILDRVEIGLRR